jgi:hypothetical protein
LFLVDLGLRETLLALEEGHGDTASVSSLNRKASTSLTSLGEGFQAWWREGVLRLIDVLG